MKELLAKLVALGAPGLFLASLLDGAGVPVPGGVDVLLVYLASRRPQEYLFLALITVLGSTAGNMFLFLIARRGGQLFLERRTASPRTKRFRQWFDHYGLLTVFISALVPLPVMPMKIFVFCSGALGAGPLHFLLMFVSARVLRYSGLAYLGQSMGEDALVYLRAHVWHLTAFAVGLFLFLWVVIHIADRRRARRTASIEPA